MLPQIKCVVWDLDNTLWHGVLMEDGEVRLRPEAESAIRTLDERGILQSIASRSDHDRALARLRELGLEAYFLHPQIHWGPKSDSVRAIAEALNLGLDSMLLLDDDLVERGLVRATLGVVACLDPADLDAVLSLPVLTPKRITEDSRNRRKMYLDDLERSQAERASVGTADEFLESLHMLLTIAPAAADDLDRAVELTERTHQLNSTGTIYGYEELERLRRTPGYLVLIAGLEDRFGSYGKIGLTLLHREADIWTIKLLLASCRVVARGVGSALILFLCRWAREQGCRLRADFVPNERNRPMSILYRFAGFRELARHGDRVLLEHDRAELPPWPSYFQLGTPGTPGGPHAEGRTVTVTASRARVRDHAEP
jgi:FkbH-like protein